MADTRNWLDNAKLRVSYGITGNAGGIGAYGTNGIAYIYSSAGVTVGDQAVPFVQYSGTVPSYGLGWEKSYNWNVGLDFGVLNGRIDGSVEWFKTTTKDLLYKRTVPITSGLTGWGSPSVSGRILPKPRTTVSKSPSIPAISSQRTSHGVRPLPLHGTRKRLCHSPTVTL